MSYCEIFNLKDLLNILYNTYYLPSNAKINIAELIQDVLKLEGERSVEEVIPILRSRMTNELKKDLTEVLEERYSLPDFAKAALVKLFIEESNETN